MTPTLKPGRGQKSGFSLLEMIVVVAVIALLSLVAYPLFRGAQPDAKARSAASLLETLGQKARIMAINQQKPIRIIVNCARPGGYDRCFIDLQSAVYTETEVTGWVKHVADHAALDPEMRVLKANVAATFDGAVTVPNIFWAIFMPTGQVYSDPRKFELFLYHGDQSQPSKKGWLLTIDNVSGRVAIARDERVV